MDIAGRILELPAGRYGDMGVGSSHSERNRKRVFEQDIVTYLPYREVTTKEEFNFSGFLIDDERVVGMSVSLVYQYHRALEFEILLDTCICR